MTELTYDQQLHLTLLDLTVNTIKTWSPLNAENIGDAVKKVYAAYRDAADLVILSAPPEPEFVKPTKREIADAVQPDSILCFEDGKRYKSLKRTVGKFGLTPAAYREKWGLPADFPMVSPNYSATRSALAREHGLGRK